MFDFLNILDTLHVRGIATRPENNGNLCSGIDVMRSDKRPGRVIN